MPITDGGVPFAPRETSREAAESVTDSVAAIRMRVYRSILGEGMRGRTCDELEIEFARIHETISALLVLSPEHARLFAQAGWSKDDVRRYVYGHATNTLAELAAVGKEAVSKNTHWRLPAGHPDAMPVADSPDPVPALNSPAAVQIMVAGANNAGVSAVIETFGPRGNPPAIAKVRDLDD